jgi:hypothetical protein
MVCGGIELPPLLVNPVMDGDEGVAIHEKLVPKTFESNTTLEEVDPVQISCAIGVFVTNGRGLIVATWIELAPEHPLKVAIIL